MGLDIYIETDRDSLLEENGFATDTTVRSSLSRSFLPLVFRQHYPNDEELLQISQITGVDVMALLEMALYPDPLDEENRLSFCETDEERAKMEKGIEDEKRRYAKPIDQILTILEQLDNSLKSNPDYYKQLKFNNPSDEGLRYFRDYSVDPELNKYGLVSHSDINLGADIRTMIKYLEFAKSKGATTTYFSFG